MSMNKKDLIVSLFIGEISAWLIVVLAKGLVPAEAYAKYSDLILFGLPIIFPFVCVIVIFIAQIVSKKISVVYQIAKFVLIGGFNTLVDWGILALTISFFQDSFSISPKDTFWIVFSFSVAYYSFFKAISFIVATTNSYFWNKLWTFKRTTAEKSGKEFLQFLTVSLFGFLINVGIASAIFMFVAPIAGLNSQQWEIAAAVAATAVSMTWNFLGYKFIVFNAKKEF